jgi:hypothetical protein
MKARPLRLDLPPSRLPFTIQSPTREKDFVDDHSIARRLLSSGCATTGHPVCAVSEARGVACDVKSFAWLFLLQDSVSCVVYARSRYPSHFTTSQPQPFFRFLCRELAVPGTSPCTTFHQAFPEGFREGTAIHNDTRTRAVFQKANPFESD